MELEKRVAKLEAQVEMLVALMSQPERRSQSAREETHLVELTTKQHAVSQLIFFGMSTKEMAEVLQVAEPTVKVHIRAIMRKLSFRTRGQIALQFEQWREDYQPHVYLKGTGIPIDWAERMPDYEDVTKMLRVKTR